jgi:ATP-dependent DNA helicase DinG
LTNHQQTTTIADFLKNFPFSSKRERQAQVLNEICAGFESDYKYILLEAPTGFGKSPVAIAIALTLGSSYICTSTKDLQTPILTRFFISKSRKRNEELSVSSKRGFY